MCPGPVASAKAQWQEQAVMLREDRRPKGGRVGNICLGETGMPLPEGPKGPVGFWGSSPMGWVLQGRRQVS